MAGELGKGVQGVEEISRGDNGIGDKAGADKVDGQVSRQAAAVGADHAHQLSIQLRQVEQASPRQHLTCIRIQLDTTAWMTKC